jgi:mersacidin/lichenicidin family type 2 lantibiotic
MSKIDIKRALKDVEYYNSLTADEKALIPGNPAGDAGLSDADLENVAGGMMESTTKACHSKRTKITGCGGCP